MLIRFSSMLLLVTAVSLHATIARSDQNDPRLVALFAGLAKPENAGRAAALEAEIWSIWLEPPAGPDVAEAMERGLRAMALGQGFDAMRAFDEVVEQAPDYAEGWNKRATVRYALGDLAGSTADIRRTLALEPRHFGALSGLGLVRLAEDKPAEALSAFEEALKINPHMDGLENIKALRDRVRGKPL